MDAQVLALAIGHSARDTFAMLHQKQVPMQAKAFAVGLRVEHLQDMINQSQYGKLAGSLPPAAYKAAGKGVGGRGVYTFCMCPGGYVVNASSEEKRLAVNGMSNYRRDGANANSAVIVTVTPEARFPGLHSSAGQKRRHTGLAAGQSHSSYTGILSAGRKASLMGKRFPAPAARRSLGRCIRYLGQRFRNRLSAGWSSLPKRFPGLTGTTPCSRVWKAVRLPRSESPEGRTFKAASAGCIPAVKARDMRAGSCPRLWTGSRRRRRLRKIRRKSPAKCGKVIVKDILFDKKFW